MTQWYVKELSKLTKVSVQTLHHYDHIGLLVPSIRLANGYRLYSEKDLLKLQQIIALKYFGFGLSQIKTLLGSEVDMIDHLSVQSQFLEAKAKTMLEASQTLKNIVSDCRSDKSIPWESIINLIEVYRMTEQLENAWVKEIFSPEELKQYAAFESEVNSRSTVEKKAAFEKNWFNLVEEIKSHLKQDPKSNIGITLGKKCMDLVNSLYGKKYAHLRTKMFEKGFGEGKGLEDTGLTPEVVTWLDQAIDAYWHHRIYDTLAQVDKIPSSELLLMWNTLLEDIYGEDLTRMPALIDTVLNDDKVSTKAKEWLRRIQS
jgi:DNA-binding transcriptional MerR regulator